MSRDVRKSILWLDGLGGLAVGTAVLLATDWLSVLYGLPRSLLRAMAIANLAYPCLSLTLAVRSQRPERLIQLLALANCLWAVLCLRWAFLHADTASLFGMAHLVGEAIYVGVLGWLEWRWRKLLRTAYPSPS